MDEREARKVQREASEALLDLGVSLPLKEWRLPFMKRPVQWRVTMRRPRLAGQICIVRLYLSMGVSPEEVSAFAVEHRFLLGALEKFISLMGSESFTSIISSIDRANPMKLRMSQRRKGS